MYTLRPPIDPCTASATDIVLPTHLTVCTVQAGRDGARSVEGVLGDAEVVHERSAERVRLLGVLQRREPALGPGDRSRRDRAVRLPGQGPGLSVCLYAQESR